MGNNHVCETMGIGTVRLKMHNRIIRTIDDVRYVSDLKKNFVSLGTLDSIWHKIVLDGKMLKVISGALMVMRGKKEGNLYFFQGSTVTGSASVSS